MGLKYYGYLHIGMQYDKLRKWFRSCKKEYQNYKYVSYEFLKQYKKHDRVFIIGSGTSINKYSDEMRREIQSNDSITFNFSMMYGISSNYHMIEPSERVGSEVNKCMDKDVSLFAKKNPETCILLKNARSGKGVLHYIDESLRQKCHLVKTTVMPIRKVTDLPLALKTIKSDLCRYHKNPKMIYNLYVKRASIFSLITLARDLGYKEIILCGIELNNDFYFYEDKRVEYEDIGYLVPEVIHNEVDIHKTDDPKFGEVTASELIKQYNRIVLVPEGIKLYIATKDSALNKDIDIYWKDPI